MNTQSLYFGEAETKNFLQTAIAAAVCFLLVNLLIIFRFGPFSDEAWDLTGECAGIYLAGGRFLVTIYRLIFSPCGVPVAYGIAAAIYFGLALAIQIKILRIQNKWLQFLFIAFSVSTVQLSYFMVCSYHADVICLGLLFVSFSYLLFEKAYTNRHKKLLYLSIIPAALGMGAYQFLGLLLPCLFLINLIQNQGGSSSTDESIAYLLKKAAIFLCWCLCIIVLYFLFSISGKSFCSPNDLSITQNYQSQLLLWGKLGIFTHILHMGKAWCLHLVGAAYTGEWLYVTSLFPLVLILCDIWKRKQSIPLRFLYSVLAMGLYIIPFLPIVAIGRDLGPKLFLAQPLTCAALWCLALTPRTQRMKHWAILAIGIFITLKACYTVSDMAFYQKRLFDQSLVLRAEIISRALQVDAPAEVNINACPIIVYKGLLTPIWKQDKYGNCVLPFGSDSLEKYLDTNSTLRNTNHRDTKLFPIFEKMPVYPAAGSIKYHDGNILVKLGE